MLGPLISAALEPCPRPGCANGNETVLEKLDEADTQLRRYPADPKLGALSGVKP